MKLASGIAIFSTILATLYGVLFSFLYPLVKIDVNLISLFAVLGLATSMGLVGIWKTLGGKRSA
jgi:hypothetical protein